MLEQAITACLHAGEQLANAQHEAKGIREIKFLSNRDQIAYELAGEVNYQDVPVPERSHAVDSVSDLIAASKRWNVDPVIWISSAAVTLVINDKSDREDRVRLALKHGAIFSVVAALAQKPKLSQEGLILLLRTTLRGAVNQPAILAAVRKVKFRISKTGHSDLQHGNESLGHEIESEVTGAEGIPDGLTISMPVFCNPGEEAKRYSLALTLDIIVKDQTFALRPQEDELQHVLVEATESIRKEIVEALPGVPVLFGSP